MTWISIKDRLPELDKFVLTCRSKGMVKIFSLAKNNGWAEDLSLSDDEYIWINDGPCCHDSIAFNEVTHWMPLPEKPNELD